MTSCETPETCPSCRRALKAGSYRRCDLCDEPTCRDCESFLEDGTFAFLDEVKPELQFTVYCQPCYVAHVEPALESYNETKERAKNVFFFFETRKYPIPTLAKSKVEVKVAACVDRNETILRMGFIAAQQGCNAIIEAEVVHRQWRDNGYQKTEWSGRGYPAKVDADRLNRDFDHDSG